MVDPRWGRAQLVAVADVADGELRDWQEFQVLRDHAVEAVAVEHVGAGMLRMLETMSIRIVADITGDARAAVTRLRA
jgi:predicted Fe-Mo cluster-binding NifX family protein